MLPDMRIIHALDLVSLPDVRPVAMLDDNRLLVDDGEDCTMSVAGAMFTRESFSVDSWGPAVDVAYLLAGERRVSHGSVGRAFGSSIHPSVPKGVLVVDEPMELALTGEHAMFWHTGLAHDNVVWVGAYFSPSEVRFHGVRSRVRKWLFPSRDVECAE